MPTSNQIKIYYWVAHYDVKTIYYIDYHNGLVQGNFYRILSPCILASQWPANTNQPWCNQDLQQDRSLTHPEAYGKPKPRNGEFKARQRGAGSKL